MLLVFRLRQVSLQVTNKFSLKLLPITTCWKRFERREGVFLKCALNISDLSYLNFSLWTSRPEIFQHQNSAAVVKIAIKIYWFPGRDPCIIISSCGVSFGIVYHRPQIWSSESSSLIMDRYLTMLRVFSRAFWCDWSDYSTTSSKLSRKSTAANIIW